MAVKRQLYSCCALLRAYLQYRRVTHLKAISTTQKNIFCNLNFSNISKLFQTTVWAAWFLIVNVIKLFISLNNAMPGKYIILGEMW